jgi:hypothetical protein
MAMTDPELDTAIDCAVRELMDVDADAAFRGRVAARLEERPRRTVSMRLIGAIAAAVVLTALWLQQPPVTTPAPDVARVDEQLPAPLPTLERGLVRPEPRSQTAVPRVAAAVPSRPQPIPEGRLVAAAADASSTAAAPALAAIVAIEAIEVEPIAPAGIATPEIVIAPLSPITDLQISPLEPRTARN